MSSSRPSVVTRLLRAGPLLDTPGRHVLGLVAVMTGVAALLAGPALAASPYLASPRLPWWLLAPLFAASEAYVVHLQLHREAQTVSLNEIPLVLGLVFATPRDLVLASTIGALGVYVLRRKQRVIKLVFNAANTVLPTLAAVVVFQLVAGPPARLGPRAWVAAAAGAAVLGAASTAAVTLAVRLYGEAVRPREAVRHILVAALTSVGVAVPALVVALALAYDGRSVLLAAGTVALILLGYRQFAALSQKHVGLERVYGFSQLVTRSSDTRLVLRSLLHHTTQLLHAEHAEVVLAPTGADPPLRVRLLDGGTLTTEPAGEPDWVTRRVLDSGEPVLLPRGTDDRALVRHLVARGRREAIVVPLRGDAGVIGTLMVADRLGDVRTFDDADTRLAETLANQAGLALQNGRLIEQLRHDALHDSLTGLPNRAMLQQALADALGQLGHGESDGLAVLVIDLDRFKDVNDTLGHPSGDVLLQEAARRLAAAVPDVLVTRLGGDEFAVLAPGVADATHALALCRRLLAGLEAPVTIDGIDVDATASVGVAVAPHDGTDPSVLLKRADLAMYLAKGSGRHVALYDPDLDTADPQRLALVGELRAALAAGQIAVHVQPKVDLRDGTVHGVEALARWRHPRSGWLGPDEFVPIAERSGLIRLLTTTVLDGALAAYGGWRERGIDIGVAVNLSARGLTDLDLADDIAALLDHHAMPADRLTLEITESSIMADPDRNLAILHRLASMGVRLSVDDFGTGYSSLAYLRDLPVRELKIDKSFVSGLPDNAGDVAIVRTIIDLAGHLSLDVVAEGVEDERVWEQLADLGCGSVQGYLVSEPRPVPEFTDWPLRTGWAAGSEPRRSRPAGRERLTLLHRATAARVLP